MDEKGNEEKGAQESDDDPAAFCTIVTNKFQLTDESDGKFALASTSEPVQLWELVTGQSSPGKLVWALRSDHENGTPKTASGAMGEDRNTAEEKRTTWERLPPRVGMPEARSEANFILLRSRSKRFWVGGRTPRDRPYRFKKEKNINALSRRSDGRVSRAPSFVG